MMISKAQLKQVLTDVISSYFSLHGASSYAEIERRQTMLNEVLQELSAREPTQEEKLLALMQERGYQVIDVDTTNLGDMGQI